MRTRPDFGSQSENELWGAELQVCLRGGNRAPVGPLRRRVIAHVHADRADLDRFIGRLNVKVRVDQLVVVINKTLASERVARDGDPAASVAKIPQLPNVA